MSYIVERLNDIWRDDDHERGCLGRNYDCTCGFDARSFATAKEAAIEIERLRAKFAEARADALEEVEALKNRAPPIAFFDGLGAELMHLKMTAFNNGYKHAIETLVAIRALKSGGENG